MGRMRGFFCAFCLEKNTDEQNTDHSFNQGIDVSHLATPHISSSSALAIRSSANSTPVCENNNDENICNFNQEPAIQANCAIHRQSPRESVRIESSDHESNNFQAPRQNHDRSISPSHQGPSSQLSHYEPPQGSIDSSQRNHAIPAASVQQQASANGLAVPTGTATKLSYDIISVREPLAKILAERQQLQQQRQILGDHEYIEVYGERGSSCFYEEIAGSTTSSATYDQIGALSNHNYQVLRNAYAVANRSNGVEDNDNDAGPSNPSRNIDGDIESGENMYDVTHPIDQTDNVYINGTSIPQPSTSYNSAPIYNVATRQNHDHTNELVTHQSIPVYSVINKATRRSNAIIRATVDDCRPPKPPPKNLSLAQLQQSTSATQNHANQNRSPAQTSISSSNHDSPNDNQNHHNRLPQPPPRLSKRPMFSTSNRPLPLPENFESTTSNQTNNHPDALDDDNESLNNGYELLSPNFDDEQIDVGYERIRESNRYSGGSMSSQFCPLQALDNGGYESLQPIYSSPSNALAEPNYEAIGPATASELAAAATARLTAAATVIEKLMKKDG